MQVFVDEREVPSGTIGPPPMNYGQHWRWDAYTRCQYRIMIPVAEFCQRVYEPFDRFSRDVADDMVDHQDDWSEPEFVRFRHLAFPSLKVLINEYPALLADLMLWVDQDLLEWISHSDDAVDTCYSANSVDSFVVQNECIEIRGIAYEMSSPL
jgi:hypothetical protein